MNKNNNQIIVLYFFKVNTTQNVKKQKQNQLIRNRSRSEIVENKPLPETTTTTAEKPGRYPKRGTRKCYREQEVPDEDHFLCKSIFILFI